ncbi:hypothetical protein P353_16610 [Comamonas testosteroni]|uniref:Uncharacterized protein n=1 Tax=Comamonas testosteroni TaxID=285 RepID=A0A096FE74_COMTE|nr:hypothetical protein P353_16610 [Comamonas testosteroni]
MFSHLMHTNLCAGLSRLSDLQLAEPVILYEHEAPGDML